MTHDIFYGMPKKREIKLYLQNKRKNIVNFVNLKNEIIESSKSYMKRMEEMIFCKTIEIIGVEQQENKLSNENQENIKLFDDAEEILREIEKFHFVPNKDSKKERIVLNEVDVNFKNSLFSNKNVKEKRTNKLKKKKNDRDDNKRAIKRREKSLRRTTERNTRFNTGYKNVNVVHSNKLYFVGADDVPITLQNHRKRLQFGEYQSEYMNIENIETGNLVCPVITDSTDLKTKKMDVYIQRIHRSNQTSPFKEFIFKIKKASYKNK